jgi:hypothetical protein
VADGFADRNTVFNNSQISYKIVTANNRLNLVRADSVFDCFSGWPIQRPDKNYFEFGIKCDNANSPILEYGNYTIDKNYNFVKIDTSKIDHDICRLGRTDHFRFLNRLNLPNKYHLFFIGDVGGYWVLKLNSDNSIILDSLFYRDTSKTLNFLAYHPIADKMYIFNLNYEYHLEDPEFKKYYGDDWITPTVNIFDPSSLKLVECDTIADSPKNLSLGPAIGNLTDVVGDYIVVYQFYCELRESFLPAMLFIFDTRTNTARWLNVGWR